MLPSAEAAVERKAENDGCKDDLPRWHRRLRQALICGNGVVLARDASAAEVVDTLIRCKFVSGEWCQ